MYVAGDVCYNIANRVQDYADLLPASAIFSRRTDAIKFLETKLKSATRIGFSPRATKVCTRGLQFCLDAKRKFTEEQIDTCISKINHYCR